MSEHKSDWDYFSMGWMSHREASKPLYLDTEEPKDAAFWNPYHGALLRNDESQINAEAWWNKGWWDRERESSRREGGEG
ncbi:MAG: hypothetical protein M3R38_21445 [Actinomycetota bacterium]|nr:hypothetical protein [Actinomycetota bacterium]